MSLINDEVLKQAITDTITSLASHIVEYEPYTDDEIAELFNLTPEEVQRITDIISDTVISQYKLWSSKKVNDEISAAKEECNTYAEELAAKITTMSTMYTDSLPVTGSSNIIYVLKETSEEGIVSHTINLWKSDINDYVKCGSIEQALNNLYTKEQIDAKLADYALKSEILSQNDLVTTISNVSTASNDKIPTELAIANALSDVVKDLEEADKTIIGTTDISSIGDGTVKGAISTIENNLNSNYKKIIDGVYMQCSGKHRVITVNTAYSNIKQIALDTNDRPIITTSNSIIRWANNGSYVTLGYLQVNNDGTIVAQKYDIYNGTKGATDLTDSDGVYGSISYITN